MCTFNSTCSRRSNVLSTLITASMHSYQLQATLWGSFSQPSILGTAKQRYKNFFIES